MRPGSLLPTAAVALAVLLAGVLWFLRDVAVPPPAQDEGAEERSLAGAEPEAGAPARPDPIPESALPALRGTVVDAAGTPVPGAEVLLHDLRAAFDWDRKVPKGAGTITAEDGGFLYPEAKPGSYLLLARHPERGAGSLPLVRVPPDGGLSVVLRLLPAAAIEGRVIASDGTPAVGARVATDPAGPVRGLYQALLREWFRPQPSVAAVTGPDGSFRLRPLLPGPHDLVVDADRHARKERKMIRAPARGVVIRLEPGGAVRGVVEILGDSLPGEIQVEMIPRNRSERIAVEGAAVRFRFGGLAPGEVEVVALATGFTEARRRVEVPTGGETEPVVLELRPGARVSGLVVEKDTRVPVGGATIAFWFARMSHGSGSRTQENVVTADVRGRYEVRLRPGTWSAVSSHPGHASEDPGGGNEFEVGEESLERDVELSPVPAAIEGLVRFRDGTPVTGARVRVTGVADNSEDGNGSVGLSDDMNTRTDAGGRFRLAEGIVPWCAYDLVVSGPGQAQKRVLDVKFERGIRLARVDVELERVEETGGRIVGRIVDESGAPVAGALVLVARRVVVTGPDGRFDREPVPPETYRVTVGAVGYAQGFGGPLEVRTGETAVLPDLVLRRTGVVIRGSVRDRRDRPVEGAQISCWFTPPGSGSRMHRTFTRADGTYRLDGPDLPGVEVNVQVSKGEFRHTENRVVPAREAVVDFVLERLGRILGRLVVEGPSPSEVSLFSDGHGHYRSYPASWDAETGAFHAEWVVPGLHRIRVSAKGYASSPYREVEVPDGGAADLGVVRLGAGGVLTGRVVDDAGRPVGGVQVAVSGERLYTDTGEDGRFTIAHVPPGSWTLAVNGLEDREESPTFAVVVKEGETTTVTLAVPLR